jgi:polyisoprenoid-binding protein YceI
MRSAFAPAFVSLAALIAALVRWWLQGSGNVYTAVRKRFYVADADLGWTVSDDSAIWLGLEVCALVLAVTLALFIEGWIARRRERRTGKTSWPMRTAAWIVALAPPVVPIAAYASGWGPPNARDVLPTTVVDTRPTGTISGNLAAPAGDYEVVAHAGTSITAQMRAGGETFDARFAKDISGSWNGDPRDLAKPMTAEVTALAAAVDTGVDGRTSSAKDTYLKAETYPKITFALGKLVEARQDSPDKLAFRAQGMLGIVGGSHPIDIAGTLRVADAATLTRLGLTGDILLATADFTVVVKDTGLAKYAGDFDTDTIPIHVSLVLRHR